MELPESSAKDLATLRAGIDGLDSALLALVRKRLALASDVAHAKTAAGERGFGFRPARELAIYRRLLTNITDPSEIEAITAIWRSLIATNLRRQGPLRIVAAEGVCATLARVHYGDGAEIQIVPSDSVLDAIGEDTFAVGLMPMLGHQKSGRWWRFLSPSSPQIVAAFPFADHRAPEALLLARLEPEEAGSDTTLVTIETAPSQSNLVDRLAESGLSAELLDRDEAISLLRIDGFVGLNLLPVGLGSTRILGSYARI